MLAAVNPGRRHDEEAFLANVGMASAVCRAMRQADCAQVVYISSDAVYPFIPAAIQEHVAPLPASLYAHMHLARETMLRAIESAPVVVLRLTQVYGAGDPHNAYGPTRMIRSALTDGRILLYGSGEETRDHIHVDEAAAALVGVLTMRSRGLINVATGRSISFAELAELVRRTCGGAVTIEHEPRRMPVMHRRFDVRGLKAAFPTHMSTPLEDGLAMMAEKQRTAPNSGVADAPVDYVGRRAHRSHGGVANPRSPAEALQTTTLSSSVPRNRSL
jgi:UDP-glucose 4-epimerase